MIQILSSENACPALRHIYDALNSGGAIYIRGAILDGSRLSPVDMVGFNLFYLDMFTQGGADTEQVYKDWLAKAGFVDFKRTILPDAHNLIRARKPV